MACKLLLHPALCLCTELPAPEMYKWKQSLSMQQQEFQRVEKSLGSCSGMGSRKTCPSQFWLSTSHPIPALEHLWKRSVLDAWVNAMGLLQTFSIESHDREQHCSLGEEDRRQRRKKQQKTAKLGLLAEDKDEEPRRTLEEGSVRGSASQGLLFCLFSAFRNVTVV